MIPVILIWQGKILLIYSNAYLTALLPCMQVTVILKKERLKICVRKKGVLPVMQNGLVMVKLEKD